MSITALANRYARALVDVTAAKGEMKEVFTEISAFQTLVSTHAELREVVVNPTIPQNQKEVLLVTLTTRMKLRPTTVNFLSLLLRNQRLAYLGEIVEALRREIDIRTNVVAADVTTAGALAEAQKVTIEKRLQQVTGKAVRVNYTVDPTIIGGVVSRIGSRIYDGSIRNQLDSYRTALSQN